MPLPLLPPDLRRLRFALVVAGVRVPAEPTASGALTLTRQPGDDNPAGSFYTRDKLSELQFSGQDYALLKAIEDSTDRCQEIGLLLDTRPHADVPWHEEYAGVFTCAECKWNTATCTVTVTPTTADPYRLLLENYDVEYNILNTPGPRQQVTAELATLAAGTSVEFLRIDATEQGDYVGTDGWAVFLVNTSWISGTTTQLGTYSRDVILFRYRLVNQPMTPPVPPSTVYTAEDKSGSGWAVLQGTENTTNHTIDYVKAPGIAGFKPYKITHYNNWNEPRNPNRTPSYGDQLLLLPCYESPEDYGYNNANYLKVTGNGVAGTPSLGGAFTDGGPCLNVRRNVGNTSNDRSLWWRFGSFKFSRGFRLRDALYELLRATVSASGDARLQALLPPDADHLGDFLTAATNPATGDTGATNEVPRLLVSAASDVKRYGASEPATRVMISLKQFTADLGAIYDAGWFVDPATGWFRFEDRSYVETQRAAGTLVNLTTLPDAILPGSYGYRTEQLPRYEELSIANAQTQDVAANVYFDKAALDYGPGGCTVSREGQNRSTRSTSRLTGDVAAGVLNGDAIPDNALFLLAPDAAGALSDANRAVSASSALLRYHRRGRAAASATVGTQATTALSVRAPRVQEGISVPGCSLSGYEATTRYTTNLGTGGQQAKAELTLPGGPVKLTAWLPVPPSTTPPPTPTGQQFNDSFSRQFA